MSLITLVKSALSVIVVYTCECEAPLHMFEHRVSHLLNSLNVFMFVCIICLSWIGFVCPQLAGSSMFELHLPPSLHLHGFHTMATVLCPHKHLNRITGLLLKATSKAFTSLEKRETKACLLSFTNWEVACKETGGLFAAPEEICGINTSV